MSGSMANVILRSPFGIAENVLVSELLHARFTEVSDTRKGRRWEFTDSGSRASLAVVEIQDDIELEAELLDADLTSAEASELVVIQYPLKQDFAVCQQLAANVADLLGGILCIDDGDSW